MIGQQKTLQTRMKAESVLSHASQAFRTSVAAIILAVIRVQVSVGSKQIHVVEHLDICMIPGAADMEIKEVWGWEIAIRLVVRRISLFGMYLGLAEVGHITSWFMKTKGREVCPW